MPALINLVVHAGTLFGWDTTPTEVGGWGLLDSDETRALVAAASRHPATRWCLTLLGPDGTGAAHGCSPGQHPWVPEEQRGEPPGRRPPDPIETERFAAFLRGLNVIPDPIAKACCDHAAAESRYTPSRKLAHLIRARTVTCDAPGCNAQTQHCDLDHAVPYPDGPTCQCNLGPKCRRHHRAKQSPGWKVEQLEFSIRSLAASLGVAPMSLYRHIRDKDDLLDEVVDRLLTDLWRPATAEDDWRAWTIEAATRLRDFLVGQPAALHVYFAHPVVSRPPLTA
jgi:hypothetical protein